MSAATLPDWEDLAEGAPTLVATMRRYLEQVGCVLRPASVRSAGVALRTFAIFLADKHPDITAVAQLERAHLEDYKRWLLERSTRLGAITPTTRSLKLGALRMFFVRLIEWGRPDAPDRPLLFSGDLPPRDQPLPKALDDTDAAKFLRAAQAQRRLSSRVVAEMLLRTGLRVSELCDLDREAMRTGIDGQCLYVPVGKLHNDRYLPLHPTLIELIGDYQRQHVDPANRRLLPNKHGQPLNRYVVARMLDRIASQAGIGHVHPHKLLHTRDAGVAS